MRILFLSQRVPYPPNRGDKITTWRLLERMRRRHAVRVIAFSHGEEDERAARELSGLGVPIVAVPYRHAWSLARSLPLLFSNTPLTLGVYGSRRLQAEVDRAAAEVDLAYAYSSSMGAFLLPHARLPWVMHMAELDSDKWRQYAERGTPPASWIHAREARTLLEVERKLARAARASVLCTPLEQEVFRRAVPDAPSLVLSNGVDAAHFHPQPERAEPGHVVFTGVMNYFPNADGCAFFAEQVLPLLRPRFPALRFSIVGASPSRAVRALGKLPGVTVTGAVPDTREWLARASLAVAPLRIARGIQNKVLEAMAMGLPVVGTTPATQGIDRTGEGAPPFAVADGAAAFADAAAALLSEGEGGERARELGARARDFVLRRYDWEQCLAPLDELLERCAARRP